MLALSHSNFTILFYLQDVVSYLIEKGADPNKKLNATCEGLTCLMIACQRGYFDMVKYLVYHGSRMEMKGVHCLII